MTFSSFGLSDALVRVIHDQGYKTPTPVQSQAIPAILAGKDVMAAAQTGTGKTAGFALPILQQLAASGKTRSNHTRALILAPTRELAAQIATSFNLYGKNLPLTTAAVYGGISINPQMKKLRRGVDILIATPGRLMDLHRQNAIKFNDVTMLVLDEADRMLDMGFIDDIKKIINLLPNKRQNMMFSATFSNKIRNLAEGLLTNPVKIDVNPHESTAKLVTQLIHPIDKARKPFLLCHLIKANDWQQVLVFTRTKHGANKLTTKLESDGIRTMAIHGNKSQGARTKALAQFKRGKIRVLVATDIASRGLDIQQLPLVINFELPDMPEDYVHRIGRTGRAGRQGSALSLVSVDECKKLDDIERLIKHEIKREYVDDYFPKHDLSISKLSQAYRLANPKGRKKDKRKITIASAKKTSNKKKPNSQSKRKVNKKPEKPKFWHKAKHKSASR